MKDRFVRGLIAGILAGIPTMIVNLVIYGLHLTTLRFLDFGVIFLYGRRITGLRETIFAGFITLMFYGGLGIFYAYLITWLRNSHYWLKSLVYGAGTWFIIYAITLLYKVPNLIYIPFKTAVSNFIVACLWGLLLGLVYNRMKFQAGQRVEVEDKKTIKPVRLRKPYKIK